MSASPTCPRRAAAAAAAAPVTEHVLPETPRRHYRVHYPIALRPEFLAEGGAYAVVDLSEGGMRCEVKALQPLPELGAVLEGIVRLKRGESVPVRGTVVRIGVAFMALAFDPGVPFRIMLEEQRWLIQRNKLFG